MEREHRYYVRNQRMCAEGMEREVAIKRNKRKNDDIMEGTLSK